MKKASTLGCPLNLEHICGRNSIAGQHLTNMSICEGKNHDTVSIFQARSLSAVLRVLATDTSWQVYSLGPNGSLRTEECPERSRVMMVYLDVSG